MKQSLGLHCPTAQRGTALVVSLIILAVVTLLGITSMQSSNSELKMAASMRDRGVAFEAAEAALAVIEAQLANDPPNRADLFSNCATPECFNKTCDKGRCFDGDYRSGDPEFQCEVASYADKSKRVEFWSDPKLNVWQDTTKHKSLLVDGIKTRVKYIVEFLCFVPRDNFTPFSNKENENNSGAPLFRITALAEGNGGRASVALQSTYKVLNGH